MTQLPVLARKLSLVAGGNGEVWLQSATERYLVSGTLYEALMPHIDGKTSADELVDRMAGRLAPEAVYYGLIRLAEQGLVRDAAEPERSPAVRLARSPKFPGSGHRGSSPAATIRRLQAVVAPRGRIRNLTPGGQSLPPGFPRAETKARRMAEAVERYCCRLHAEDVLMPGPADGMAAEAVQLSSLLHISDAQYHGRGKWNGRHGGLNHIPVRLDSRASIDWTPAWSLTRRKKVYLPAAYCYLSFPIAESESYCRADSNGCASGNTKEEAILSGFLELVERDAVALWWYNRVRRPAVALEAFGDRLFGLMKRETAAANRTLAVIDITTDLGIPAFAALSWLEDGTRIGFGFGAHLDARAAIRHAVLELSQVLWSGAEPAELRDWYAVANTSNQPYVVPSGGERRTAGDYRKLARRDLREDVKTCIRLAEGSGMETIVLDLTRRAIGFPVVRVVVPGLRSFAARLGSGRLYEVPVRLGWLREALPETAMNPIPFFL